jgi:tRNA threonylcarbamoyladenosine biosynthesis protein TsaE
MTQHRLTFALETIEQVSRKFLSLSEPHKKFAFYGAMGSGKTTFITALCHTLGAVDLVSSPTFSIVNEYATRSAELIYHFDFYRIKTSEELFDIGFEEYNNSSAWCFIEWPDRAPELISGNFVKVFIEPDSNENRIITFEI